MSFCFSNLSFSCRSRPNARTTRTPVRFSCATCDSAPSSSSALRKVFCRPLWKSNEYKTMIGMNTAAAVVSAGLIPHMKKSASTISTTMRNRLVSCSERKRFTVSTSDVQRWIRSPVSFFDSQANGSFSMCVNSISRMVFTRRSAPPALARRFT